MEFADQKRYLLEAMIQNGWNSVEELPLNLTQGLPAKLVQRWIAKFYKSPKIDSLPRSLRLVNRFMVGADPEFTFAEPLGGEFVHANNFKLHVGLAFGADLAGRPVELRPAPSRFALDVVASILSELRWMALTVPGVRKYSWISRPYVGRDGIGGHIHFGRKQGRIRKIEEEYELIGKVKNEINGLDSLTEILQTSLLMTEDCKQRARVTVYGRPRDIRPQTHGYEYRTLPTWLSSPWLAYLMIVLAKLTVYDPELIRNVQKGVSARTVIRNILAYYKGLDDDALIAYTAIKILGFPVQDEKDFKTAWGLNYANTVKPIEVLIPEVIEPTDEDREQIFKYLTTGLKLTPTIPVANWQPTALPENYVLMNSYNATVQRKGIGELIAGLATHKNFPIQLEAALQRLRIGVPDWIPLPEFDTPIQRYPNHQIRIELGQEIRQSNQQTRKFREWMLKHFPVWKVEDVKPDSLKEFRERSPERVNLRGRIAAVEVV